MKLRTGITESYKKVQNKSSILVCTFFDLYVIMKNQMTG